MQRCAELFEGTSYGSQGYVLDYASLGRARVILDDGFASGSVARDGRWSMCVTLLNV